MSNVFVYGTLMSEEVVDVLISRQLRRVPARVRGYRRHRIKGFVFPAIVPASDADEVPGLVLYDLTDREMQIFDEFEGDEYYKTEVKPLLENGEAADTSIYVWQESARHMLYGAWDYQEWRQKHLEDYLKMCRLFKDEVEQALGVSNRPYTHGHAVEDTQREDEAADRLIKEH